MLIGAQIRFNQGLSVHPEFLRSFIISVVAFPFLFLLFSVALLGSVVGMEMGSSGGRK